MMFWIDLLDVKDINLMEILFPCLLFLLASQLSSSGLRIRKSNRVIFPNSSAKGGAKTTAMEWKPVKMTYEPATAIAKSQVSPPAASPPPTGGVPRASTA